MSLTSHVYTYLHACTGLCILFEQGLSILNIRLLNALRLNCYVCYQMIQKLF